MKFFTKNTSRRSQNVRHNVCTSLMIFTSLLCAGITGVQADSSTRNPADQSVTDLAVASQVALPCIDCTWQGAWCKVCIGLPLTLGPGGVGSASEVDLERLAISPWLNSASRCIVKSATATPVHGKPVDLNSFVARLSATGRAKITSQCINDAIAPSEKPQNARWALKWDKESQSLKVFNSRNDDETAIIIAAIMDNSGERIVNVSLDRTRSIVPVAGGERATLTFEFMKLLQPSESVEFTVISAGKITSNRSELSTIHIDHTGETP